MTIALKLTLPSAQSIQVIDLFAIATVPFAIVKVKTVGPVLSSNGTTKWLGPEPVTGWLFAGGFTIWTDSVAASGGRLKLGQERLEEGIGCVTRFIASSYINRACGVGVGIAIRGNIIWGSWSNQPQGRLCGNFPSVVHLLSINSFKTARRQIFLSPDGRWTKPTISAFARSALTSGAPHI